MKRKLFVLLTSVMLATAVCPVSAMCSPLSEQTAAENADGSSIQPRADIIDYQYKVVNNVLYRRLYNYTLNKPLSDWVRVK